MDSDISNKSERTTALVAGVAALGVVLLAIVFAIIIVAVRSKKSGRMLHIFFPANSLFQYYETSILVCPERLTTRCNVPWIFDIFAKKSALSKHFINKKKSEMKE